MPLDLHFNISTVNSVVVISVLIFTQKIVILMNGLKPFLEARVSRNIASSMFSHVILPADSAVEDFPFTPPSLQSCFGPSLTDNFVIFTFRVRPGVSLSRADTD